MKHWAESDPASASAWLNDLPAGKEKQTATLALVKAVQEEEPAAALAWARTVPQSMIGGEGWCELVDYLHAKDPAGAAEFALSPEASDAARSFYQRKYLKQPNADGERDSQP